MLLLKDSFLFPRLRANGINKTSVAPTMRLGRSESLTYATFYHHHNFFVDRAKSHVSAWTRIKYD